MPKRIRLGTVTNGTLDSTDATIEIDGDDLYITVENGDIRTDGTVAFEDATADPDANGEIQRNGADLKAYSGGAVRNLTSPTFESVTAEDIDIDLQDSEGSSATILQILSTVANTIDDHRQRTDGVSTSATTILTATGGIASGGLVIIAGDDTGATNRFVDLVFYDRGTSGPEVLSDLDAQGTPAGRTYSSPNNDPALQLAMASDTYNVSARSMEIVL